MAETQRDYEVFNQMPGAPVLVVFGGLAEGFAVPPYEFANFVARLSECNVVFLRDSKQVWYQGGVRGLGATLETASKNLVDLLSHMASTRVVFTGNSAGGFGAIQTAALVSHCVDRVEVFSPQTILTEAWRHRWRDSRWPEQIAAAHSHVAYSNADQLDLRQQLRAGPLPPTRVHFAGLNRLDSLHALRLAGTENVSLRPYRKRSHSLVKALRDDGRLVAILRSALQV